MLIFYQIWSYLVRPENFEKLNIPKTGMLRRRGVLNTPTLFPSIVLTFMFLLCAVQLVLNFSAKTQGDGASGLAGWRRGAVFFGIMTVYALAMVPIGFIISSAITIAVLSLFIGNRNIVQIIAVALLGPVLLYLAATRLLAVSLPELNGIELAISRMF